MTVPCKDCTERHMGCHSECEKYRAFRATMDAISLERQHQVEANTLAVKRYNKRQKPRK